VPLGRSGLTSQNRRLQTSQALLPHDLADRVTTSLFLTALHETLQTQPNSSSPKHTHSLEQIWPRKSTSTVPAPICAKSRIEVLTCIEVLNIQRSATKAEIKKAYHKVNHPTLCASQLQFEKTNTYPRPPSHPTPTRSPTSSAKKPTKSSKPFRKPTKSSATNRLATSTMSTAWRLSKKAAEAAARAPISTTS
jgi:hypothetical protein